MGGDGAAIVARSLGSRNPSKPGTRGPMTPFHSEEYRRHTSRRLEHLASLGLPLTGRRVLDVGAGVGDHASFYLDRGCEVISLEPRAENVEAARARCREAAHLFPSARWTVLCADVAAAPGLGLGAFDVVHAYGILYHLARPLDALGALCALSRDLVLVETACAPDTVEGIQFAEDGGDLTNALDGACSVVPRAAVVATLGASLGHAYYCRTQPAHPQFPRDWNRVKSTGPWTRTDVHHMRFVAIGSRGELALPLLTRGRPIRYDVA